MPMATGGGAVRSRTAPTAMTPAAQSAESAGPPAPPRSFAKLGCVVAVIAAVAASALAGGAAYVFWNADAQELTEGDDWRGIATALGPRGVAAEATCGAPPYLQHSVTLDDAGAVEHVDVLNYAHEPVIRT
jgi:hypothetical protein